MERFESSHEGRKKVSLIVLAAVALILIVGLFNLQILQHDTYLAQSENNRIRIVPEVPRRGRIYDRTGTIIVDNRPSYTVSVIPAEENKELTRLALSGLLDMDTVMIGKRIRRNLVSWYQPAAVKRDVSFEAVAILEEQNFAFPGIAYQMERVRQYPEKIGMEAFTGYVGEVSQDELERLGKDKYRLGSMIGKKGLERQYDDTLRGYEGTRYIEVSATGQILGDYKDRPPIPPTPGADIHLTIDLNIQLAASKALDTFCCGAIIAMDPRDGGILAMVSYPGYDANIFSSVIPESLWNAITADSTHPLLNRPLNGLYPPGSTTKFVTLGAGLEQGLVSYNSTFKTCLGGYQFGNRFFKCWKPAGHGAVNGVHALEVSCDTYFYQLGEKLGVEELSRYYGMCGFGKPTGVDLPRESSGLNPNRAYYDKRLGKGKWTQGQVLNNSIGQGELLVNIIQLAQFFCGLVMDGNVYKPHFLKQVLRPNQPVNEIKRQLSFKLPFSDRTLEIMEEGLRLVVEGKDGTAKKLKSEHYTFGGKTGTAQNPHGENHSWFAAVAPLDNPEIVIVAIVENSGDGSAVAAPLIKSILDVYFNVGKEELELLSVGGEE